MCGIIKTQKGEILFCQTNFIARKFPTVREENYGALKRSKSRGRKRRGKSRKGVSDLEDPGTVRGKG